MGFSIMLTWTAFAGTDERQYEHEDETFRTELCDGLMVAWFCDGWEMTLSYFTSTPVLYAAYYIHYIIVGGFGDASGRGTRKNAASAWIWFWVGSQRSTVQLP